MCHWRGVKSGNRGLKSQNFPVNSLLLYAIDRKIVYLRQEYKTSRANPAGCFLPRNLVWILTITDTGLATAQKRYRIQIYRWHKIPPESEIVFKQDLF